MYAKVSGTRVSRVWAEANTFTFPPMRGCRCEKVNATTFCAWTVLGGVLDTASRRYRTEPLRAAAPRPRKGFRCASLHAGKMEVASPEAPHLDRERWYDLK